MIELISLPYSECTKNSWLHAHNHWHSYWHRVRHAHNYLAHYTFVMENWNWIYIYGEQLIQDCIQTNRLLNAVWNIVQLSMIKATLPYLRFNYAILAHILRRKFQPSTFNRSHRSVLTRLQVCLWVCVCIDDKNLKAVLSLSIDGVRNISHNIFYFK